MSTLRDYLVQKREAILTRRAKAAAGDLPPAPSELAATVTAEGRSGVRRLRIRDFQILTDSPPDFAGYNLGPSSPELQLGVLGTCITHIYLIQAADAEIPLDSLSVDVKGQMDHRSGQPGFENVPIYPHNIHFTVHLESPASSDDIAKLHHRVENVCPIFNLLLKPQTITSTVIQNGNTVALASG